jgi:S-adenosylmethionine:tRNA ribosyltransferase-isomerase
MSKPDLHLSDYTYNLPDDRIARFPEERRDRSKLLHYYKGNITHHVFSELPGILGPEDFLILNNTRVFSARLFFKKPGGGIAEALLLEPVSGTAEEGMKTTGQASWRCMLGNARNWKNGSLTVIGSHGGGMLTASRSESDASVLHLEWHSSHLTLSEVLQSLGHVPLPPYLRRTDTPADKERYQTVFAEVEGSVAAPTASLHFTPGLLSGLRTAGIESTQITLHVGAGTFLPIKTENISEHEMHSEFAVITRQTLSAIINALQLEKRLIAVGTTAMRTLESIYWAAWYWHYQKTFPEYIEQWVWTDKVPEAPLPLLETLHRHMLAADIHSLRLNIALMITPGYTFGLSRGLITNFHQPGSSLILLVAAFTGASWKDIYREALANDYRFLSYGDGSLILP